MKRTLLLLALLSILQSVYGQEKVDSSEWELVIPNHHFKPDKQNGNIITIGRNDLLSMAASQDDPRKLLIRFPGFTNFEEGNNGIVFRSLPSQFSGWSINGAEILNPNHLNTGGLYDSRFLSSAGRVHAISSQVMGDYTYRHNPDSYTSMNYLAGISNVSFRTPYRNQVNLNINQNFREVGIDLRKNKFSFLTNYRSSKKYLIPSLPIKIEKDTSDFNDLFCKLKYANPEGWNLELYYINGKSDKLIVTNNSSGTRETSYNRTVSVSGFNINKETFDGIFETTTNLSNNIDERVIRRNGEVYTYADTLRLLSHNTSFTKVYDNTQIEYNFNANLSNFENQKVWSLNKPLQNFLIQPGVFFKYSATSRLHINTGLNYNYFKKIKDEFVKKGFFPTLGINWVSKDFRYNITGKFSITQQFQNTFHEYGDHHFPKSQNYSLAIHDSRSKVKATLFLNKLSSLVQSNFSFTYHSTLQDESILGFFDFTSFSGNSTADIYGLSIDYFEELNSKTFLSGNITMQQGKQYFNFDSLSTLTTAISKIPLLSNLICNLSFSKKELWRKNLDLEISTHFRSSRNNKEGYDDSLDNKIPHYFRGDLRLNYHMHKVGRRYKSLLSLDIQNITWRKNGVFYRYDGTLGEYVLHSPAEIIPTISWRIVI